MDFALLTFGELLQPLNGDLKNKIRNFENNKKQILSAKYGILFNQTSRYIIIPLFCPGRVLMVDIFIIFRVQHYFRVQILAFSGQ